MTSSSTSTTIKTTTKISIISSLFTSNNTGTQLNGILETYIGDLTGCLANCSNQAVCMLDTQQKYICQCKEFKNGLSCQSDTRPCSSNPCLNNGVCSNVYNGTLFE